jgi:hypothetical protein
MLQVLPPVRRLGEELTGLMKDRGIEPEELRGL